MAKNETAELSVLIVEAGRRLHQRLHGSGQVTPISMLHFKIMCFVRERSAVSMKDIASFLGITPPSATVLVERLVKSGELRRIRETGDRRQVKVALTAKGKLSLAENRKILQRKMESVLARLTAKETKILTGILKRLLEK